MRARAYEPREPERRRGSILDDDPVREEIEEMIGEFVDLPVSDHRPLHARGDLRLVEEEVHPAVAHREEDLSGDGAEEAHLLSALDRAEDIITHRIEVGIEEPARALIVFISLDQDKPSEGGAARDEAHIAPQKDLREIERGEIAEIPRVSAQLLAHLGEDSIDDLVKEPLLRLKMIVDQRIGDARLPRDL